MPYRQHYVFLSCVLAKECLLFGYILPNLESLEEAERQRYRAVYCGVCQSLKERYGQLPRLTVSYDLTFLSLVLGSLYEAEEKTGAKRCPMHPTKPQSFARSIFTDYAADLSVAFAYHKMLDDWRDDHTVRSRVIAGALSGAYRKAKKRIPKACDAIEVALSDIQAMEGAVCGESAGSDEAARGNESAVNNGSAGNENIPVSSDNPMGDGEPALPPDAPANRFGLLLGDVFAFYDDFWATDLRRFGARLGKFVYVMDAAMDLEEDLRTGSYNPFRYMEHDTQALRDNLEYLAAAMTDVFERLPLERDIHVMQSVLYAGVWQRFEAKENKTDHG